MTLKHDDAAVVITFVLRAIEICRMAGVEPARDTIKKIMAESFMPTREGAALLVLTLEQFDKMVSASERLKSPV